MEVRTCRQCKKLFNYLTGPNICQPCKDALEKKFQEVKQYIEENPSDGITKVAEANDVSTKQIQRWIREERLAFSAESGVGIECESCGAMILSGRLCQKCKDNLIGAVNNMYKTNSDSIVEKKHREAARMRFLDN
ncbi:MAG: flagellar protein [Lachnospiraceae bacterium]|nr:flagellar protein [Lachnospiraceae bacterium]